MFDGHFRGETARDHWGHGGSGWCVSADLSTDPIRRKFVEIADECHASAVTGGPQPLPIGTSILLHELVI